MEEHDGNYWGTVRSDIDSLLDSGFDVIVLPSFEGALVIKSAYGPQALVGLLCPPSLEELQSRIIKSGTDVGLALEQYLQFGENLWQNIPDIKAAVDFRITIDVVSDAVSSLNRILSGGWKLLVSSS